MNLVNGFDPEEVQLIWVGARGTAAIRPYVNPNVVTELLDADYPLFTYLSQQNAYLPRSRWLWTKIIADHVLRLVRPARALRKRLCEADVDLIVSNSATVTIGALMAKLLHKPHVWSVKGCLGTKMVACRNLARLIEALSDVVIGPSRAVTQAFEAGHLLRDGNDVPAIMESARRRTRGEICDEIGFPYSRPIVAQVGGVSWWKGQHVTVEAMALLAQEFRAPPCSFLFLGRPHGSYAEALHCEVKKLGKRWQATTRFYEFPPTDFSVYDAADIVVHPSVLPDPLPNAVREAMLLGKPVIGSNSGGIPEMIEHGKTGLLIEPGNATELATAIRQLIASPHERWQLGEHAKRYALERFDIRRNKQDFLRLFQEVVENHARRRHTDV